MRVLLVLLIAVLLVYLLTWSLMLLCLMGLQYTTAITDAACRVWPALAAIPLINRLPGIAFIGVAAALVVYWVVRRRRI